MKQFNSDLRSEYMQMSTNELEKRLDEEVGKQIPNDDIVLTLLHILKDREPKYPLRLSAREEAAVKRYQQKRHKATCPKIRIKRLLSLAASLVLILTLLFTVAPQKAEAETFWEMLQRITSKVLEYIAPQEALIDAESEYSFATDNSGLQEVYDAVIKLGIAEPVVPMWLPEGSELIECSLTSTPVAKGIYSCFSYENKEIIYKLDIYSGEPAHQYYKDDTQYESLEWDGVKYHITQNNGWWSVVWTKENIECFLTLDCQEDTLYRILRSIYVTEVQ